MNKYLTLAIMLLLLALLGACADDFIPVTSIDPSAQPLFVTLTEIAKTVEYIGQTATAYAVTPTATPTPTNTPDQGVVYNLISEAIADQLLSTFGANITVENVKFGPLGSEEFTNLYVEIKCVGDNGTACPTSNVIVAVMEACREKKKKMLENSPKSLQMLTITIFDPINSPRVVEIDWSDIQAYLNGDIPADVFDRLIRYVQ
jgi:hypothetical protein